MTADIAPFTPFTISRPVITSVPRNSTLVIDTAALSPPGTLQDRLRLFLAIDVEVDQKEQAFKDAKAAKDALEAVLIQDFIEAGLQNLRTASGFTVYLNDDVWAFPTDQDRLQRVLRRRGFKNLISHKINAQTLRAWVKEQGEENLPKPIKALLTIDHRISLRIRKA